MRTLRILGLLIVMTVLVMTVAHAAEANFSASSLTAQDVDCKKCHAETPHKIHAQKPVDCAACHGDKLSVSIPKCTKCHDGPIHEVHKGKVSTQTCSYCHKTITQVHNNLMNDAVCSHCHKDLVEVHGNEQACTKCHRSQPDIVKPLKLEGTTLICQNCHPQSSVATIHGVIDDKQGCYKCHGGTSQAKGSEIPHVIHATKVDCKGCHEENQKVVVPRCPKCHDIDTLHAFNKIGKLTSQSGLQCSVCHPGEAGVSAPKAAPPKSTSTQVAAAGMNETSATAQKAPGFGFALAIAILISGYIVLRRRS